VSAASQAICSPLWTVPAQRRSPPPEGELRTGGRLDELDRAAAGDGEPFARLVADDLHAIPYGEPRLRHVVGAIESAAARRSTNRRRLPPVRIARERPSRDPRQTRQFGSIDQYGPRL